MVVPGALYDEVYRKTVFKILLCFEQFKSVTSI